MSFSAASDFLVLALTVVLAVGMTVLLDGMLNRTLGECPADVYALEAPILEAPALEAPVLDASSDCGWVVYFFFRHLWGGIS